MLDYVDMLPIPASLRRELGRARVAHLATVHKAEPTVVPVCFVFLEKTLYHAIDAKPKRRPAEGLQRVRNLRANPEAAAIIDHYDEDWRKLWFAILHGHARFLRTGIEHRRAIGALKRKYLQYRRMPLDPGALVIAVDVRRLSYWNASLPPKRERLRTARH